MLCVPMVPTVAVVYVASHYLPNTCHRYGRTALVPFVLRLTTKPLVSLTPSLFALLLLALPVQLLLVVIFRALSKSVFPIQPALALDLLSPSTCSRSATAYHHRPILPHLHHQCVLYPNSTPHNFPPLAVRPIHYTSRNLIHQLCEPACLQCVCFDSPSASC